MTLIRALFALSFLSLPVQAETPLVVELVTAERMMDVQTFSLTGETVARDPLVASFATGGRISAVLAQEGDLVKAGAPLVRMDSVQQEQALRAAEAGLSTAQADHLQAIEDFERQKTLLQRGATTRIGRDSAEDALRIAEGVLTQAQAELERAEKALGDTVLLAPKDATVIDRMVEPGQVVGAAQPVMSLALGDDIDVIFEVPEVVLTGAKPTGQLELSLIEYPEQVFSGTPREVSPLVDPVTGTVAVTVTIIDPPSVVSYGDAVRGTATFGGFELISLPYRAMTATAQGPAVWVVDPDSMTVSLQQVEVARFETGRVILRDGIEAGTRVVARGAQLLYPGRTVQEAGATQ